MKRRRQLRIITVICAVVAIGAGMIYLISGRVTPHLSERMPGIMGKKELKQIRIKKAVDQMSIEEKIGQVLLMDFRMWLTEEEKAEQLKAAAKNTDMEVSNEAQIADQPEPHGLTVLNEEVRGIIADYHLGNIILFGENCVDPEALTHLTYDLQHAAIDSGNLPLIIGADQEGGNVTRLGNGTCMSGNMAVGASGEPENAHLTGQVIGSELNAVGINCDFAPVADVNSNRDNPVIGMRSFSDDPTLVAEMAAAMAKGLEDTGTIACAKHFPGHGNTDTDSHTGLPLVEESYEEWWACDGVPFKKLAEQGNVGMVMTAHIQYPGLDDTRVKSALDGEEIYLPATLSKTILTDILKEKLGFQGVVVTDAMNMEAIADNFGPEDAVIRALDAGADLVCIPVSLRSLEDLPKLDAIYAAIKSAVSDGMLAEERLDDAVMRVVRLKNEAGILTRDYDYDVDAAAKYAADLVGGQKNRAVERQVAEACINIVYDGIFVPFSPAAGEKIAVFMPYDSEINSARYAFNRMEAEGTTDALDVNFYSYQYRSGGAGEMTLPSEEMLQAANEADYIILGSEQTTTPMRDPGHWLNTIPAAILKAAKTDRIVILCAGLPYQAEKFSAAYPCVMLYNYSGMNEADIYAEKFTGKFGPAVPAGIETVFKNERVPREKE